MGKTAVWAQSLALTLTLGACGGGSDKAQAGRLGEIPRIDRVGPRRLAVGDTVDVVGADFVGSEEGTSLLRFRGRFVDDAGRTHAFERIVTPKYHHSTRLSWRLWPDIVFHPDGNRLGTFSGELSVVNEVQDGTREVSDSFPVQLELLPSLVVRALGPAGSSCAPIVSATTGDTPLALAVEAVGFRPGSAAAPLAFSWTLGLEQLELGLEGPAAARLEASTSSAVTITHEVTSGAVAGLQDPSGCARAASGSAVLGGVCDTTTQVQSYRLQLDQPYAISGFERLRTRMPEPAPGPVRTPIQVEVRDADGHAGRLLLELDIFPAITFERDSKRDRIVSREAPLVMAEVTNDEAWPRYVVVQESSELKEIELSWPAWPASPLAPPFLQPTALQYASLAFGIDLREGRSSSNSTNGYPPEVDLPPGSCATFYRQAIQVRRFVRAVAHDRCGESHQLGEIQLDDWQWRRESAVSADGCPVPARRMRPAGPCEADCR